MFNNIFRKYDFDNLYIGIVTVYRSKSKKPSCVKVDVPPELEKVSYITILNRLDDRTFLQIDNCQYCFYYGEFVKEFSNYPVVTNIMTLGCYYEKYQNKKDFFIKPFMNKSNREKIIKDVTERAMVI